MTASMHILAESDPTLKIIIGLAFAGLWVIAQLLSSLGKKKDKTRPPELDYPLNVPPETPMPPPRSIPQPQRQAPPRRQPQVQRQPNHRVDTKQRQRAEKAEAQRRKEQARQAEAALRAMHQQQRGAPTPPPLVRRPVPTAATMVVDNLTDPALRRERTSPTRAQRLSALLRPANLRKEFILTELLQPPLATREPPRDRQ